MLKQITLAATSVAMLALGAPTAHAAVVKSGCGFDSVAQSTVTGGQDTFTGGAYGYAVFDDQGTHTLRCYVAVDGTEQSSTPSQSGIGVVATAGQVTYFAAEGAAVDLCTEIDGVTVECGAAETTTLPPPAVQEAEETLDTIICPILASLSPGVPGVVDINPDGDVTLVGAGGFWDCPPYGDLF